MEFLFLLFISWLNFRPGLTDKALRFQKDSKPTINSTAVKFMNPSDYDMTSISTFSLSLWFKIDYFRTSTYVFSYSTSDAKSNQLNLRVGDSFTAVVVGDSSYKITTQKCQPNQWYHFIAILRENTTSLQCYIDGELVLEKNHISKVIHLNGTFVLGQETDSHNGGFVDMQSFSGWISHFNLYSRVLDPTEMEILLNCKTAGNFQGDIVSWKNTNWQLNGIVTDEDIQICTDDQPRFTMIAQPFNIEDSKTMCMKMFRSPIFVPRNEKDNFLLHNETVSFIPGCKSPNHHRGYLWLGATDQWKNGHWMTFQKDSLNWTNFRASGKSSGQSCLTFIEGTGSRKWDDIHCHSHIKLCPVCELNLSMSFTMRGLCEEDNIHARFKPSRDTREKVWFKGFTRYNIIYEKGTQSWQLDDIWKNKTLAKLFVPDRSYPFGTKEWTIVESYQICNIPREKSVTLSFTNCVHGEFNCGDGSCISMEKRCDLRTDCPDSSDEDNCKKLIKSDHYMKNLFPPGPDGEALKTNLSVTINKISDVDVQAMKLFLDLTISVSWFDSRVRFSNLNGVTDLNIIPVDDIWRPQIEFVNADFKEIVVSTPSVSVTRRSSPIEDNISRPHSDPIFEGDKNFLTVSWKLNAPFDCDMYLYEFPFDDQKCRVNMKLKSSRSNLISWYKVSAGYLGPSLITEYQVKKLETSVLNDSFGFSVASIEIPLSRRYSYYVTTTFIPTFMLVLISYMSFFCKAEHVDLRVMMTITTLLVLYSLYQQIEGSLPKTSYVKAIDLWCFFCLIMIMTMVIFHILIGASIQDDGIGSNSCIVNDLSKSNLYQTEIGRSQRKTQRMLRFGQITYIIVSMVFLVVYFLVIYYDLYLN